MEVVEAAPVLRARVGCCFDASGLRLPPGAGGQKETLEGAFQAAGGPPTKWVGFPA